MAAQLGAVDWAVLLLKAIGGGAHPALTGAGIPSTIASAGRAAAKGENLNRPTILPAIMFFSPPSISPGGIAGRFYPKRCEKFGYLVPSDGNKSSREVSRPSELP